MAPGMWKNPAVTATAGALAGILLGFAVGRFCAAECPAPSPATPLPFSTAVQDTAAPTGAELKRAADRALRDAGLHRGESAGVILQETLEDGSRMVSVRLGKRQNGARAALPRPDALEDQPRPSDTLRRPDHSDRKGTHTPEGKMK